MSAVAPDNLIVLMDNERVKRSLRRMCFEIIEQNRELTDLVLLGLNTRGYRLAEMLKPTLLELNCNIAGLYRIDTHIPLEDQKNNLPELNNANIIIIDDVLFSGKTMLRALEYVMSSGEPSRIQVAVLVDRGHRLFPVQATYTGLHHPTKLREHVQVQFHSENESVSVNMFSRY
jgi:pyrimidine operon attenuation protein/uracil phosphoribosyltransferase